MTPRKVLPAAVIAVSAVVLAACSSTAADPVRDQNNDVPFTGCDRIACTGTIDGAAYEILMPEKWNGTLLLYSHGYRPAQPFPPDFSPADTTAAPVPGWNYGDKDLGNSLLSDGYALAGSSYSSNGWAVEDGVKAGEQLHDFFAMNIAVPKRVYVWGDSLGGLVTQTLAEKHPDWIDGVAPLCGVVGGAEANFNIALDLAYAFKILIDPQLKLTNFTSYDEAVTEWSRAASTIVENAKSGDTALIAKILAVGQVADGPTQTRTFDGSTMQSTVAATVESLLTAIAYGTVGRQEAEARFGGNFSGNAGVDYAARFSDSEKSLLNTVGGDGTADAITAALQAGPRISPDPAAQKMIVELGGNPSGEIQDPTITMHTKADSLVIVQNESLFGQRYNSAVAANKASGGLVQLYTVAPTTYPEASGAPYGAGHCNFTNQSRIAVIDLLDRWVRNGVYPGLVAIRVAMGNESGYDALYRPSAWPAQ
jgi:hypothetical protein